MNQVAEKSTDSATDASWLNKLPIFAGVLALLLVVVYAFTFRKLPAGENPAAWGTFGDYMGGLLNPLISLFTLIVAMKVWGLQKTELLETRRALEEQGRTAEQQRREQRFFDFLNIYRSTVDSIEFEITTKSDDAASLKGKRALRHLTSGHLQNPFYYFSPFFEKAANDSPWIEPSKDRTLKEWDRKSPLLDHYFRVVFTVLREAEPILKEDCNRYMKLLRAQLSRDETSLIALNLLYDNEGSKMRDLVGRYGMLKHMPSSNLRDKAEHELDARSFGNKWASVTIDTPTR